MRLARAGEVSEAARDLLADDLLAGGRLGGFSGRETLQKLFKNLAAKAEAETAKDTDNRTPRKMSKKKRKRLELEGAIKVSAKKRRRLEREAEPADDTRKAKLSRKRRKKRSKVEPAAD